MLKYFLTTCRHPGAGAGPASPKRGGEKQELTEFQEVRQGPGRGMCHEPAAGTGPGQRGKDALFDIDVDDGAAAILDDPGHVVGKIGGAGGANDHQQIRVGGSPYRAFEAVVFLVVELVEPEHMRPQPRPAARAMQVDMPVEDQATLTCLP